MKKLLSEFIFWISNWKVVGDRELPDKCLIIVAPHTSNWDFVVGKCFAYIIEINAKYLIKSELFLPILGTFFRKSGGIPIYRNSKNNIVDQISQLYNSKEKLVISVAPEGTREKVDRWKTGFYHIAIKANISIILAKLDYKKKEVGFICELKPTGNLEKDFDFIQKKYKDILGRIPENYNEKIY